MELISPRPAVTARFEVSLPYDIFTTLILLDGPYKGISEWVVQARALLAPDLADRVHLLVGVLRYGSLLWGKLTTFAPGDPARRDFPAFLRRQAN